MNATIAERSPPANFEAEQALLGSILVNNSAWSQAAEMLKAEHFADPLHGRLFDALGRLIERGQVVNAFTLKTYAEQDEGLKAVGGPTYLARLMASSVHAVNVPAAARTVRDCHTRRRLINVLTEALPGVYDAAAEIEPAAQIEAVERGLYDIAEGTIEGGFKPFKSALTEAIKSAEVAHSRPGAMTGLPTGLRDLDDLLGGLNRSDLIVVAGRPGMGKAQSLESKVLMRSGEWKALGDLRLGDDIASHDGAPSRVAGIFPRGQRQLYRVEMSDGRVTEACGEHLWRVSYRSWDLPRIVDTHELQRLLARKRYQRRLWVESVSGHFGHDDQLPIDPWLLGALLGDGDLSALRLTADSEHVVATAAIAVGQDFDLRPSGRMAYRIIGADGPTATMRNALRSLGLWGLGSEKKFIPAVYKQANREARLQMIRGLMDTDGWVEKFGAVCFGTTSRQLADDFAYLIRSVGGVCSVNAPRKKHFTHKGERREGLPFYVCGVSYRGADALCLEPKKRERVRLSQDGGWRRRSTIASVTPSRIAETACIRVTHSSNLYVTDDFIVTHNSALASNIGFAVAEAGATVGFFSLEMSSEQLATRIVAEQAGVAGERVRRGQLNATEMDRVIEASGKLQAIEFYLDDTPAMTVQGIRTRARRLKRQHGLDLIIIDYLQLIDAERRQREGNRVQEVSEITRGLKTLAKELDVPVIALSQLSRNVEQRSDKHPQLSDLRESGSIEQDADVVIFIYREEYYRKLAGQDWSDVANQAELAVAKNRHGPTGTPKVHFDGPTTRFSDIDRSDR